MLGTEWPWQPRNLPPVIVGFLSWLLCWWFPHNIFSFFLKLLLTCSIPWFGLWSSFYFITVIFLALSSVRYLQFYIPAFTLRLKCFFLYIFNFQELFLKFAKCFLFITCYFYFIDTLSCLWGYYWFFWSSSKACSYMYACVSWCPSFTLGAALRYLVILVCLLMPKTGELKTW